MVPIAYRVSQCKVCRKYLTFQIRTQEEWIHWSVNDFNHCGQPAEFVRIMGREEYESLLNHPSGMQPVCCSGESDVPL